MGVPKPKKTIKIDKTELNQTEAKVFKINRFGFV